MIKTVDIVKGFKTPESRWARFGPYYAMFPLDFAFEVVEKYSKKGDFSNTLVLDKTHHPLICDSRGLFESQLVFFSSRKIPEQQIKR